MKKIIIVLSYTIGILLFTACSDTPSSALRDEQYEIINDNVKKLLGEDYDAENFSINEEGYANEEKTKYVYKFKFDLNKQYMMFDGKNIPGELQFDINDEGEWECTFNSANAVGFFNLLKM